MERRLSSSVYRSGSGTNGWMYAPESSAGAHCSPGTLLRYRGDESHGSGSTGAASNATKSVGDRIVAGECSAQGGSSNAPGSIMVLAFSNAKGRDTGMKSCGSEAAGPGVERGTD